MVIDTVADALIRIKNGYLATKAEVTLPYSKLVKAIVSVLEKEGYVGKLADKEGKLVVILRYDHKSPALTDVKRVSKPGLRVYKGHKQLPMVLGGVGIALMSTPKGVMTNKQARKEGVGGEVLAYVW